MTNHRNRTKKPYYRPTAAEVKQLRESSGLTQEKMAELIRVGLESYQRYESESANKNVKRGMDASKWDLMKIRVAEHILHLNTSDGSKEDS